MFPTKRRRATQDTVETIKSAAFADTAHRELTLKRQAFLNAYLETGNGCAAYRRSHNCENMKARTIEKEASRLLKHPGITRGIEAFRNSKIAETMLTIEEHMIELKTLRELAKASGLLSAAIRAEELRGKLRGFYVEQHEHGDTHAFDRMSDEELRAYIAEEAAALGIPVASTNGRGNGTKH
jgi:phage terminase small subunit